MLQELYSRIQQSIVGLPQEEKSKVFEILTNIDVTNEIKELQELISKRYTAKSGEIITDKAHLRKGIVYKSSKARISSYQALNKEQLLEANKVFAKLTILENEHIL